MNPGTALLLVKLLDMGVALLAAYPLSRAKFERFRAEIDVFVKEGRDPRDEELAAMIDAASRLHEDIQQA